MAVCAWSDLVAPCPGRAGDVDAGTKASPPSATRSPSTAPSSADSSTAPLDEQWIDAGPRDGKAGGAFCMSFFGARSLVLLNWAGSADSAQTLAHELGHAYHNTTLADRTYLQRRLPMALAETASIFCETLVVENAPRSGSTAPSGWPCSTSTSSDRTRSSSTSTAASCSRREVFARAPARTLGVTELNELMLQCPGRPPTATGSTSRPRIRTCGCSNRTTTVSHFYNWPYTYGLLFGLGLFARYREDPERFRPGYETLLSRAGMDTAEELGAAFGLDVTDEAFWTASLDVIRARIADYERLAADVRCTRSSDVTVSDVGADPTSTATGDRRVRRDPRAGRRLLAGEPRYRVDQVWDGCTAACARRPR